MNTSQLLQRMASSSPLVLMEVDSLGTEIQDRKILSSPSISSPKHVESLKNKIT